MSHINVYLSCNRENIELTILVVVEHPLVEDDMVIEGGDGDGVLSR